MADAAPEQARDSVIAADGARIPYLTVGQGPGVVVVPGALSLASRYGRFAAALGERFTVHTIERRGHGDSAPQPADYRIGTDVADLAALLDKTGASLVVGHSFGGAVALEAARKNPAITKLAVYEPGVSIDGSIPTDWMPAYEKFLNQGKPFDAFVEFVRSNGPDAVRRMPRWMFRRMMPMFMKAPEKDTVVGQLPENLREHRELARLDNTYPNYAEIIADVLILDGDKDRRPTTDANHARLARVIPESEVRTLSGLDHFGLDKGDPRRVAAVIGDFLARS
ncbi:alpha/beta fold hydrolase [Nocardia sp. NPDC020380]|uniref:alpha/beta fold hydrolase n=1 Tax=Nocardia sp. NPDC020380 TaxID=3364309 RepID=UPI0037B3C809